MTADKIRVRPGKELKYSSPPVKPPPYNQYAELYDWCESNYGEYNHRWSVFWRDAKIQWSFSNQGDLVNFLLVWF